MKKSAPTRRTAMVKLAAAALSVWTFETAADDFAQALRKGGVVLFLRHATTTPGVGDPPGFTLEQCNTQRNLSAQGIEQAKTLGLWFKQQKLKPSAVKTSAWCRCKDTATLAFGKHQVWNALNSTFNDRVLQPNEIETLKAALAKIAAGKFEVWVSHGVNARALTGEQPAMGEAFLMGANGKLFLRKAF